MAAADPHLTILIVVYNETPVSATTVQSVARLADRQASAINVWDNSPANQEVAFRAFFDVVGGRFDYVHTPQNLPLSVIYNRVADSAGPEGFLLILDQDTDLPVDYLTVFRSALSANPACKLLVPTISVGGRLASPSPFLAGWGRAWPSPRQGLQSTRAMTIINSGLFASLSLFHTDAVRYDERLVLYGTDTQFFRCYARVHRQFYILPTVIHHHLSFDDARIASKVTKLQQMFDANRIIYCDDGLLTRALVRCVEWLVRLRYAWRYRSFRFLAPVF